MNEPRRLKHGGGASQRLLDSASLDRAGPAARERASAMISTNGAFSRTSHAAAPQRGVFRTFATWAAVGAAASVALAYAVSRFLTTIPTPGLEELGPAAPVVLTSDIKAEPPTAGTSEQRALASVHAALDRGEAAAALGLLDEYDRTHPQGADALYLRVLALRAAGRRAEARAVHSRFAATYPQHPLLGKLHE